MEQLETAGGSLAPLQAKLQQLEQQLAAKDASIGELQQETERRAADSGEAREQLHQLQQEVAELQRQQHAAGQQAQQRLTEVTLCPMLALWGPNLLVYLLNTDSTVKEIFLVFYTTNDVCGSSGGVC